MDGKKRKRNLLVICVNLASILIILGLAEVYLRAKGIEPYVRAYPGMFPDEPNMPWARYHELFGWTIALECQPPEINPQGFRDPRDFEDPEPRADAETRVMVLGDSFVYGDHMEAGNTIPSLLQAKLGDGYTVYNLGVSGWGVDQMYLAYQHYRDILDPDVVVLAFVDDDVRRVMEGQHKPVFAIENGELVPRPPASKGELRLNALMAKNVIFGRIVHEVFLITEAHPVVEYMLLDIAQEARAEQKSFLVVRIPTLDHAEPLKRLRRRLRDFERALEGTEAIYLDPAEQMMEAPDWRVRYYLNCGHTNEAGNAFLADYLLPYILATAGE